MKKKLFYVLVFFALISLQSSLLAVSGTEVDQPKENKYTIEVSFGFALMNIDSAFKTEKINDQEVRKYPVPSSCFLLEWLGFDRVTFGGMVNIPVNTSKEKSGNSVEEKNVATALGAGFTLIPLRFEPFSFSSFELQTGILGCTTVNSTSSRGNFIFPMTFFRFRVIARGGFSLYLGLSYAFQKDTLALLYGVGHRF